MRVKALRSVTFAYTGPSKGVHTSMTSISDLKRHLELIDTMLSTT